MKTVNFIEAINSGKRFRPVDWDGGEWVSLIGDELLIEAGDYTKCFFNSQFELEEKQITITESQMNDAIERVYSSDAHLSFISLKRELGF
jgi:hypothetical protein